MTKYLGYVLLLFSLLITSCASKGDKKFEDQVSSDLVKEFDLKDEKFDKFKVGELDSPVSKAKKVIVKKKSKKAKKKKKKVVKAKKKLAKKNTEEKKKETQDEKDFVEVEKEKEEEEVALVDPRDAFPEYPAKYPKKFLDYDRTAEKFWYDFSPVIYPGEEFVFEVSFLGVTAGHVKMVTQEPVEIAGKPAYHFKAHMKSARYYSMIYKLDDSLETFVSIQDFLPIKYTLIQNESIQKVNDLQLFDRDTYKTYYWYKRIKRGQLKKVEKKVFIPRYFQDSYSPLYFVRGFPMKLGDVYEFPIITRAKLWIIKIKVDSMDEVKIQGKWVKAYKLKAETRFPGVLSKRGDIIFWYSADEKRRLLKFEAKVKIGSVEGILIDYKEGRPLNSVNDQPQQQPINLFYIALSDEWGTQERLILRDCRIAKEAGHHVFLYCYRDSAVDIKAKRRGIKTVYHQGTMSTKLFRWHTLSQVTRLVRDLDIKLVHIYDIKLFWPISYFLRRKHEIPLVLTQVNELKKFYRNIWFRPLSGRLDLVLLPVSEMVENIWGHLGIPPRKTEFCGLGLTPDDETENGENGEEEESRNYWEIGCSVSGQEKEPDFLMTPLKMLDVLNLKKVGDIGVRLSLINAKPWDQTIYYDELRKLVKDMGLEDYIVFVDRTRVVRHQRKIDLWLGLPRKEDLEDYSVSALMVGCPVVIPRTSASVELIREQGKIGETYKKSDIREMSDKCRKVLTNLKSYRQHLERASSNLEILYSYEAYRDRLLAMYQKIILRRQLYVRRKAKLPLGRPPLSP